MSTALVVLSPFVDSSALRCVGSTDWRISHTIPARTEQSVRKNMPFHRWNTKKLRCLPGASSGVLYCESSLCGGRFGVWLSVRGGDDVRHPHDADDVQGVLRNPRAFR